MTLALREQEQLDALPPWLRGNCIQQAQDKSGNGAKVVIPHRAMMLQQREKPDRDMPDGLWMDLVWDMMSYKEVSLKAAKFEVYKSVTGHYPGLDLQPWKWHDEYWRKD